MGCYAKGPIDFLLEVLMKTMRFRHVFMGIGSFLVILLWLLSDPDSGLISQLPIGAGTLATFIVLTKVVVYMAFFQLSGNSLFDYLDIEEHFKKAKETPEGAGKALIAVGLGLIAVALVLYTATH